VFVCEGGTVLESFVPLPGADRPAANCARDCTRDLRHSRMCRPPSSTVRVQVVQDDASRTGLPCTDLLRPVCDGVSLAWRSARVLWLAWTLRRQYKATERQGEAAHAARDFELEDRIWEAFHVRVSTLVCRQMISLQGVWIKLGQFLSTRADVLPDAWVEQLRTLQDAVPKESWRDTSQTLTECFGPTGLAAFAHIDTEPLACASVASVHRASLSPSASCGRTGEEVVIKVQRRRIRGVIESDLRNLRFLVRRAAKEDSSWDYVDMIDEWADETLRERARPRPELQTLSPRARCALARAAPVLPANSLQTAAHASSPALTLRSHDRDHASSQSTSCMRHTTRRWWDTICATWRALRCRGLCASEPSPLHLVPSCWSSSMAKSSPRQACFGPHPCRWGRAPAWPHLQPGCNTAIVPCTTYHYSLSLVA
jgi:hypothetical protein